MEQLAAETLKRWTEQVRLRNLTASSALVVRYRVLHSGWTRVSLDESATLTTAEEPTALTEDAVRRLHDELYRPLIGKGGTLVILGEAGSGKTSAMILLLLAALRSGDRQGSPVPVWASLPDWNPMVRLDDWLVETLLREFPELAAEPGTGRGDVRRLLRDRRVALFLDGLDEMPPDRQRRALERIDREAGLLPVVISSRSGEYRAALGGRATAAQVIRIEEPTSADAHAYLLAGWFAERRDPWQAVVQHMKDHPDETVARTLRTPLMLTLAREAYVHGNPRDMIEFTDAGELRRRLFAALVEAAYPDPDERMVARQWLSWIAARLRGGRSIRWWELPHWYPRYHLLATATLVLAPLFGLAVGAVATFGFGSLVGALAGVGAAILLSPLTAVAALDPDDSLVNMRGPVGWVRRTPRLKLMSPRERLRLLGAGVALGISAGSLLLGAMWLVRHTIEWGALGIAAVFGVACGLSWTMEVPTWQSSLATSNRATPFDAYRSDLRRFVSKFVAAWAAAVLVGTVAGYINSTIVAGLGFARWSPAVHYGTLLLVVCLLPPMVFATGLGSAFLLLLVDMSRFLASWGVDRPGLMRQLRTATDRQLLRQVGTTYQFRHVDLQVYLASQVDHLPRLLAPVPGEPPGLTSVEDLLLTAEQNHDGESYERLGDHLRLLGLHDSAIDAYWAAVEHEPDGSARRELQRLLEGRVRQQRSTAGRGELADRAAEFAQDYLTLGNLEACSWGWGSDAALASYQDGLKLAPRHAALHRGVGEILAERDDLAGAAEAYRQALRFNDTDAEAHRRLADVLLRQDLADEAAEHYELAIRLTPIAPPGETVRRYGFAAETRVAYRPRTRLAPDLGPAQRALGDVLFRSRCWDEAFDSYQSALYEFTAATQADSGDVQAYVGLGDACCSLDRMEDAVDAYRAALESAADVGARCGLGRALLALDRPEEAERVLAPVRGNGRVARWWGTARAELGHLDDAEPFLRASVHSNQDDGATRLVLAELHAERGDARTAEVEFRRAVPLLPEPGSALRGLGEVIAEQGRHHEAEKVYHQALESHAVDRLLYIDLAEVLASQGREDEAARYLDRARRNHSTIRPWFMALEFRSLLAGRGWCQGWSGWGRRRG